MKIQITKQPAGRFYSIATITEFVNALLSGSVQWLDTQAIACDDNGELVDTLEEFENIREFCQKKPNDNFMTIDLGATATADSSVKIKVSWKQASEAIAKAIEYLDEQDDNVETVVDGRHRAFVYLLTIGLALTNDKVDMPESKPTFRYTLIDDISHTGNVAHELAVKLDIKAELYHAIDLMNRGLIRRESDIPSPKRGKRQLLWSCVRLADLHGVPVSQLEQLLTGGYRESLRKASRMTDSQAAREAIDDLISDGKVSEPKPLTKKQLSELAGKATSEDNIVGQVLRHVAVGNELAIEKLILTINNRMAKEAKEALKTQ